ncbi:putative disease resistance protein RGA3 [Bienertia sinuspersici]
MAEGIISDLVIKALEVLGKAAFKEAASWCGARDELTKLGNTMRLIQARVRDAEKRQEDDGSESIREWLRRLRLVLYRADDLFDERLANEIMSIRKELDAIKSDMAGLDLRDLSAEERPMARLLGKGKLHLLLMQKMSLKENMTAIMGKIFKSFTGKDHQNLPLEEIKQGIRDTIESNKYLLVLDDLWDEGGDRLIDLMNLLKCGKQGSKVIVTTRSGVVARIVGTICDWKGDCHYVGDVPLAIKVVGGFLRSMDTEEEWLQARDAQRSKAQLSKGNDIMDVLKVSYDYLLPVLKQCFAYCSFFPKGGQFDRDDLVNMWMAQGYFEPSNKDIGDRLFLELLARNFFQDPHVSNEGTSRTVELTPRKELPNSIGKLIHLRYLDIDCYGIEVLPYSITRLENLQTLRLEYCSKLKKLPRFGKLTSLRKLNGFIVGKSNGIDSLPSLNFRGHLEITFREWRQNAIIEAQRASIKNNDRLTSLRLLFKEESTPNFDEMNAMINHLQLPPNLRDLLVTEYKGDEMPSRWLEGLTKLESVRIKDCKRCRVVPHLSQLPCLRSIELNDLNVLEYLEDEDNVWVGGGGKLSSLVHNIYFPSLEVLQLQKLPRLKGWTRASKNDKSLIVENIEWKVFESNVASHDDEKAAASWSISSAFSPTLFTSLKELSMTSVTSLVWLSISSSLCNLNELTIVNCEELRTLRFESTNSIQKLEIMRCKRLRNIDGLQYLSFLERLQIIDGEVLEMEEEAEEGNTKTNITTTTTTSDNRGCQSQWQGLTRLRHLELMTIPKWKKLPSGIACLTTLKKLSISDLDSLIELPQDIGNLCLLDRLYICECPKLKSLPKSLPGLTSLQSLGIKECPHLEERYKKPDGEDCHLIQHIPKDQSATAIFVKCAIAVSDAHRWPKSSRAAGLGSTEKEPEAEVQFFGIVVLKTQFLISSDPSLYPNCFKMERFQAQSMSIVDKKTGNQASKQKETNKIALLSASCSCTPEDEDNAWAGDGGNLSSAAYDIYFQFIEVLQLTNLPQKGWTRASKNDADGRQFKRCSTHVPGFSLVAPVWRYPDSKTWCHQMINLLEDRVMHRAFKEAASWWVARDDLKKLEYTMTLIQARVRDAEKRQEDESSEAIKEWLRRLRLRLLLYRANDLFDEVLTLDCQKQRMESSTMANVGILFSKSGPLCYNIRLANEIKSIRKEVDAIKSDMSGMNLKDLSADEIPMERLIEKRETAPLVTVVPIVGIGGLGKTTIAQLVLNDETVTRHFDLIRWAYIPERDDLIVIMRKIFKSFTNKNYDNLSLEQIQRGNIKSIEASKYLLVLYDLWDEGSDRLIDLMNLLKCGKQGSKVIVTTRYVAIARIVGTIDAPYQLGFLADDQSWVLSKMLAFKQEQENNIAFSKTGKEIVTRGFFQDPELSDEENVKYCKMHDLMHDLAQQIASEESIQMGDKSSIQITDRLLHVNLFDSEAVIVLRELPSDFAKLANLRHLLLPQILDATLEAQRANLKNKDLLTSLELQFEEVIPLDKMSEMLMFLQLPLNLRGCKRCKVIPQVSHLPYLKEFQLIDSDELEYVADEDNVRVGGGGAGGESISAAHIYSPSLEVLCLRNLPCLKGWKRASKDDFERQPILLPCLLDMKVDDCSELMSMLVAIKLESLCVGGVKRKTFESNLMPHDDEEAVLWSSSTPSSSTLYTTLKKLSIMGLTLESVMDEEEEAKDKDEINSISKGWQWQGLNSLRYLTLSFLKWEKLPSGINSITTLQKLMALRLKNLTEHPQEICKLSADTETTSISVDSNDRLHDRTTDSWI